MIELFEQDIRSNERQSSKGNQLKWKSSGNWYKADYTGYEGLAEYVVSALLQKSTLHPQEYVRYDLEQIQYKSIIYNGVKSANLLEEDWQIITLERLFKNRFNQSLTQSLWKIPDVKERLLFLTSQVERITGLKDFGIYLNKLFTIDAFFLNEDRHMHNIAVLMNQEGKFAYCPIFDHGAALLSDTTMDYPLGINVCESLASVKSKSICDSLDEQLDASEEICGNHLQFNFSKKDVEEILDGADIYSDEIRKRVAEILYQQMRKYKYLF